jgi:rhodanese-related sulfurtransferase
MKTFLILVMLSFMFATTNGQSENATQNTSKKIGEIINVDEKEAHELIMSGKVIPVDVRTPEEYAEGYIKYSIIVDYKGADFVRKMGYISQDKPLLLYCRSGRRSLLAAEILTNLGYPKVYNLRGGIISWKEQVDMILKNNKN